MRVGQEAGAPHSWAEAMPPGGASLADGGTQEQFVCTWIRKKTGVNPELHMFSKVAK